LERETADLAELLNVVLERLASQEPSAVVPKCEGGLPRCLLQCCGPSLLKSENVIPTLHYSDVS
jgi:hypothetical protein